MMKTDSTTSTNLICIVKDFHSANSSDKKVISFLEKQNLNAQLIPTYQLTPDILRTILSLAENGFDDFIRKSYKKSWDISELTISEVCNELTAHPERVKTPILFGHRDILFGYNEQEIEVMVQKEKREKLNYLEIEKFLNNVAQSSEQATEKILSNLKQTIQPQIKPKTIKDYIPLSLF